MTAAGTDFWQQRIDRARELAARTEPAAPLLLTYAGLLALQRECYEALQRPSLSGSLDRDLPLIRASVQTVLRGIASSGPAAVAADATGVLNGGDAAVDAALVSAWRESSNQPFVARMVLQPYAESLAKRGVPPVERPGSALNHCPFCGGAPQLAILHSRGDDDGGGRQLLCATCFTRWPIRRILCAYCGEEDERRLAYYHSPSFDHLRVDACDTCRRYLKTVDLTRLGHAVPLVDEVAGASLDLWAREQGYEKIELNLVGL